MREPLRGALMAWIVTGTLILSDAASPCHAEESLGPLLDAARTSVAERGVVKTPLLGSQEPQRLFKELPPEGAILVGFDLGVGKFIDIDTVYALRPIFLTANGELVGKDHGLFANRRPPNNKDRKSKVLRTVRVRAPSGYAVGGITIRSGMFFNGLAVTFMRVNGQRLDPGQAYVSDWVGDRTGGGEKSLGGDGTPVVGVFGSEDNENVRALGLYLLGRPAPASAPPAREKVEAPAPQAAAAPAEKPAPPQPEPAAAEEHPPETARAAKPPAAQKTRRPTTKQANAAPVRFESYTDAAKHYAFTLPDGWRVMPGVELDKIHDFVKSRMPGQTIRYDGGLRPRYARPWTYPYVLIQVQPLPVGELSYDELERSLTQDLPVALKQVSGALSDVARDLSVGSAVLDRDSNRLVLRMQMDVGGVGRIQGLSVGHIGADHVVFLHAYARDQEFERYVPLFTEMNKSFHFDPGHEFKPALPRPFTPVNVLVPALVGLTCALLIGVSFFVRKKSRGVSDSPDAVAEVYPLSDADRPAGALTPTLCQAPPAQATAPPPFFNVLDGGAEQRVYRVYVAPEELLFLDAGSTRSGTAEMFASPALLGGLLGGMIAGAVNQNLREKANARQCALDTASLEELVQVAEVDRNSFRAPPVDLSDVTLDPPAFFASLGGKVQGSMTLTHRERGKLRFEFHDMRDMQRALELLPGVLGDQLVVNVALDRSAWKFVRKA